MKQSCGDVCCKQKGKVGADEEHSIKTMTNKVQQATHNPTQTPAAL